MDRAKEVVNATVQEQTFREDIVLQIVNQSRSVLGGEPVLTLRSDVLKTGLTPPTVVPRDQAINVTLLEKDIQNLHSVTLVENQAQIAKSDEELRALIETIRSDARLLRALSLLELTQLGMTLIDETGRCPLCDTEWPPGRLRAYLEQRISTVQVATQLQQRIRELSAAIAASVNKAIASIREVIKAAEVIDLKDQLQLLQSWPRRLERLSGALDAASETYPDPSFGPDEVQRMLAPDNVVESLASIRSTAGARYPPTTAEQTAWDTLTRLEENLKVLERAEDDLESAALSHRRASVLLQSFQEARDDVLGKLYEEIGDRFVGLYRQLHGLDEDKFAAKIEPEGPALNFEVDFYGSGTHPPHALHSEGHQDSMGLCLYLALAEQLTGGLIDLVMLDDVVMSVDADHRREVCRLLATSFPGRQFLITTHDKTWANELKSQGVVDSRGTVEFYNWHVQTGPQVNYEVEMWQRIGEDLERNDVPSAAGRLRRGLEQFFGLVCDSLQALVPYKLNGRWELGDFLPAGMGKYRSLLGQAKNAAQSWSDNDRFEMLQEVGSVVGQIYARSNAEQWAVNANVHYNNWANFSEKDFRPVVEAFQDLCGQFVCSSCGGMLFVASAGKTPVAVRCSCGKVDWNLTQKGKAA